MNKIITFVFVFLFLFAPQASAITITYIGHATVLVESNGIRILTDPFFGDKILGGLKRQIPPAGRVEELPPIDVVLISHTHPDYFARKTIAALAGKPKVIRPWGMSNDLKRLNFVTVIELKPWEEYKENKVKIAAIPAKHMAGHCLG